MCGHFYSSLEHCTIYSRIMSVSTQGVMCRQALRVLGRDSVPLGPLNCTVLPQYLGARSSLTVASKGCR